MLYVRRSYNTVLGVAPLTYIFSQIAEALHDKMTECRYTKAIETFDHGFRPEKWFEVDVLKGGRKALEEVNSKLGIDPE